MSGYYSLLNLKLVKILRFFANFSDLQFQGVPPRLTAIRFVAIAKALRFLPMCTNEAASLETDASMIAVITKALRTLPMYAIEAV